MAGMVPFTSDYTDQSTHEGYQFEFACQRCGNGYASTFQHSVTGFGGRLLQLGGDLLGGPMGEKASQVGFDAAWMRDGLRGSTRDKALAKAVEEMGRYFAQCLRCGQWVCTSVCWNGERGLCVECAPKLAHEIVSAQAQAQVAQVDARIQQVDWASQVDHRGQHVAVCPVCGGETGGGRFCQHCGTALTARECTRCGTSLAPGAMFCTECGLVAG